MPELIWGRPISMADKSQPDWAAPGLLVLVISRCSSPVEAFSVKLNLTLMQPWPDDNR